MCTLKVRCCVPYGVRILPLLACRTAYAFPPETRSNSYRKGHAAGYLVYSNTLACAPLPRPDSVVRIRRQNNVNCTQPGYSVHVHT